MRPRTPTRGGGGGWLGGGRATYQGFLLGGSASKSNPSTINVPFWQKKSIPFMYLPLAWVAGAWKWWAQEKTGAREGETLTPRVSPSRAPVFSFAHYFQAPATQPNLPLKFMPLSHTVERKWPLQRGLNKSREVVVVERFKQESMYGLSAILKVAVVERQPIVVCVANDAFPGGFGAKTQRPRMKRLGLSLLRNQTGTLVTQARPLVEARLYL